jgi:uncharacterized protein (TIGR02145 family)
LPDTADWNYLVQVTDGGLRFSKLKSTDWRYGTDESGFSALPGGHRFLNGSFNYGGYYGHWWSAIEADADRAWNWSINSTGGGGHYSRKNYGYSVRCVRD